MELAKVLLIRVRDLRMRIVPDFVVSLSAYRRLSGVVIVTKETLEMMRAEWLAEQLLEHAHDTGMSPADLVITVSLAQRLLQKVLFPRDVRAVIDLLQEADATFKAESTPLEGN
jgi:hypothetical protein